jgi:osmoprotectant transport system substrate-binding protein
VITVGSFDFPESVLLAYLYAGALSARGYTVRVLPDLGSRKLVEPALMTGLIQLVSEYTGPALEFVSLGRVHATASVASTARNLERWMGARGIIVARPSAAQDANAIVVTAATAARYRLRTVSDLTAVAPALVFGGPP